MTKSSQEIRRAFLHYFKEHGHTVVPSSPVLPHDDPTLLFTNAGMNQFKDLFLGKTKADYKRAASSQTCIRVGGKHNDLENVGHTTRHLTFFEMLGNFSFGDYFKKDAIRFSWEVSTLIFGFDPDRIWPTVYEKDDEAFELWKEWVPENRITRMGEKDNFWAMGEVGPCGPCSELLYDRGPTFGKATSPLHDNGERFLEFWNLVFMQYNKTLDGVLDPLPKPSIDTGAGLERIMLLSMGVKTVFETDILKALIEKTSELSGVPYLPQDEDKAAPFRVIADHLRTLAFAIADGVQPSNVDRGYVLRKVLRRAVRYGKQLGFEAPFLGKILPKLIELMGEDFPALHQRKAAIEEALYNEEEAFFRTLKRGGALLKDVLDRSQSTKIISGQDAFKLKDTYGLPLEEILLVAKDTHLQVDLDSYHTLEKEAKERSRQSQKSVAQMAEKNLFLDLPPTEFVGYDTLHAKTKVQAIAVQDRFVDSLKEGESGLIFLDNTPFYAEMGGQVGDQGIITSQEAHFQVSDCKAVVKGVFAHVGVVTQGTLKVGDPVEVSVEKDRRQSIMQHHTATHLLHWALAEVLGPHIKQAGSVVAPDRLRFDFSHHKALTDEEIKKIEAHVNHLIRVNSPVVTYEIPYEEAKNRTDIKQFFGEKYGNLVRVVEAGPTKELCGGTHLRATGEIGYFRLMKESSIASGVRRIEAVVGVHAESFMKEKEDLIEQLSTILKTPSHKLIERVEKLIEENHKNAADLKTLKEERRKGLVKEAIASQEKIGDHTFISAFTEAPGQDMRDLADEIGKQVKNSIIIVGSADKEKAHILVKVGPELQSIEALPLLQKGLPLIQGSGGGKGPMAQGAGNNPQGLQEAIQAIRHALR